MPTVRREGPFRFFFYSNEGDEPPHVHVEADSGDRTAKLWLDDCRVARTTFSTRDTSRILDLVERHRDEFEEAWHEHFRG